MCLFDIGSFDDASAFFGFADDPFDFFVFRSLANRSILEEGEQSSVTVAIREED